MRSKTTAMACVLAAASIPAVNQVGLAEITSLGAAPKAPVAMPSQNAQIDFARFIAVAEEVRPYREKRRVTEDEFLMLAAIKGALILDTRSKRAYDQIHLRGAVHLNFSDITSDTLQKTLGDKHRSILIYCNNNFRTSEPALAAKMPSAALNIPTFVTLYAYGYKNVHELGPVVDLDQTRLPLEGSRARTVKGSLER